MPRYLTFDEKTASALREQVPENKVFEHGADDALDYALGTDRNLVAVMPGGARQAAVAVFRKRKTAQAAPLVEVRKPVVPERNPVVEMRKTVVEERKPVASVAMLRDNRAVRTSGFLGLSDESFLEEERPAEVKKQSWWRKLWPEDE